MYKYVFLKGDENDDENSEEHFKPCNKIDLYILDGNNANILDLTLIMTSVQPASYGTNTATMDGDTTKKSEKNSTSVQGGDTYLQSTTLPTDKLPIIIGVVAAVVIILIILVVVCIFLKMRCVLFPYVIVY